jgi:hypothetical protein
MPFDSVFAIYKKPLHAGHQLNIAVFQQFFANAVHP